MKRTNIYSGAALALSMLLTASPVFSEDKTTTEEVRTEVSQAMDAISKYSAQQRDQAVAKARDTLSKIDKQIEHYEHKLQDNWANMSESARQTARDNLKKMHDARNKLSERYGALQSGASNAWDELRDGFKKAWDEFSKAWSHSDKNTQAN